MSLKSFLNVEFSQFSCKPTFENNSELNFQKENVCLTLFMMGEGGCGPKRPPPTSFSPETSTNVRFGPQNFLTFIFNPFPTPVQNFKFLPSASPKLLNLNQDHPSKKAVFLVKSL